MGFTVLAVARDEAIHDSLGLLLASLDLEVSGRSDLPSFLHGGAASTCLCIVLDRESLNVSCEAFLGALKEAGNQLPVLLLSNADYPRAAELARGFGVSHVIRKPLIGDQLESVLTSILQRPSLPFRASCTVETVLSDGSPVLISFFNRGVLEEDLAIERQMGLDDGGFRFFAPPREVTAAPAGTLPPVHYRDEWAITAYRPGRGPLQEIGCARYRRANGGQGAEFMLVVDDHWDALGLTRILLEQVVSRASAGGFAQLESLVDRSRHETLALAAAAGFELESDARHRDLLLIRRKLQGGEPGAPDSPGFAERKLTASHERR